MLGLTILVVEEEYLVAAEIEATLLAAGASKVVIARDLHDLGTPTPHIDLAIMEAKLGAPASIAFATSLQEAGIPVVVHLRRPRPGITVHRLCFPGEALRRHCPAGSM